MASTCSLRGLDCRFFSSYPVSLTTPVQVLRLLETFDLEALHGAVKDALRLGAIGYGAVKHLVLCRIERRPPKLDLDVYPYLPRANVATTATASYMSLLGGGAS